MGIGFRISWDAEAHWLFVGNAGIDPCRNPKYAPVSRLVSICVATPFLNSELTANKEKSEVFLVALLSQVVYQKGLEKVVDKDCRGDSQVRNSLWRRHNKKSITTTGALLQILWDLNRISGKSELGMHPNDIPLPDFKSHPSPMPHIPSSPRDIMEYRTLQQSR